MSANQNLCMSIQWLIITLRSDCSPRDTTSACSFWHYGRHVTAYDASLLMVILCWHIRGHVCAKMTTEICHVASCQKQAFKHKNLHQPKWVQGNLFFLWYPAPPLPHLLHHFHFFKNFNSACFHEHKCTHCAFSLHTPYNLCKQMAIQAYRHMHVWLLITVYRIPKENITKTICSLKDLKYLFLVR